MKTIRNIQIKKVRIEDKDIIVNLMQLYQYDFSAFGGDHLNELGRFVYGYLDSYWKEKDRYPFLITVDGEIAGFSFINRHSFLGNTDVYTIAEFFILKYFRRSGIGTAAAKKIVELFPGKWEVSQTAKNLEAQEFWLKFVQSLTGNKFEKKELKNDNKIILFPEPILLS
jgi:predicted acetyltransferase